MRLTKKLLSFLNQVFDKDPGQFLALRLQYAGGLKWRIADGVLTTTTTGGPGSGLSVNLASHTISSLVGFLSSQPGYSVAYIDRSEFVLLSSLVLLDGSGDIDLSNGDHLYGYTSVLWSYMESAANEAAQAEVQIGQMLRQMTTQTASAEWLDELGGYYGVLRLHGEDDAQYGPRIIAEVLRPRGNNVALEMAISVFTGQATTVTDVVEYDAATPKYDETITHNAARLHDAAPAVIYGKFDVGYGYDLLNGGDVTAFRQTLRDLIDRLRDAGTHLRSLLLQSSSIGDTFTASPTDGSSVQALAVGYIASDTLTSPADGIPVFAATMGQLSDSLTAPVDSESLDITYAYVYGGIRSYNSNILHQGGSVGNESL